MIRYSHLISCKNKGCAMKKLLILLLLSACNMIAMEQPNLFKEKLPMPVCDLVANFLPARKAEDDNELKENAKSFVQGKLTQDIVVKNICFHLNSDVMGQSWAEFFFGGKHQRIAGITRENSKGIETIWKKTLEDSASTIDLFSFSRDHSKIILSLNTGQLKDACIIYDRKQEKEMGSYAYGCDADSVVSLAVSSDGKYAAFLTKRSHDYVNNDYSDDRFLKYYLHIVNTENNQCTDEQCLKELPYLFPAPNPVIAFNKQETKLIVYLQLLPKQKFIFPAEIEPDLQEKEFIELHSIASEEEHNKKSKKTWKEFCQENDLYKVEEKK